MSTIPEPPFATSVHAAIAAIREQWMSSFAQQDLANFIYTENAQLFPAYSAAITGRAAIQAFWQGCIDMGISALRREPSEIDALNETVNEIGAYKLYGRSGKLLDVGKYIVIWKWEQGRWQIYRDIWTSNLPPLQRREYCDR